MLHADRARSFETLDVLRGVAALAVVAFHFKVFAGGFDLLPHGYLAVDLFFALSGFVLSFAYQKRLDAGQSTRSFLATRLIRLYPLYLLGLLLGIAAIWYGRALGQWTMTPRNMALVAFFNALLLPSLARLTPDWRTAFPYNPAAWSLFGEVAVNVGHALFLRRRSTRTLIALLIGSGAMLSYASAVHRSIDFGVMQRQTLPGLERVCFSYIFGMLLYRVWCAWPRTLHIPALLPAGLLIATLAFPYRYASEPAFDLLSIALVFPAVILLGAYASPHPRWRSITTFLGTTSYATYVIHLPLIFLFLPAWKAVTGDQPAQHPWLSMMCFALPLSLLSFLLDSYFDLPVRAWLRARFQPVKGAGGTEVIAVAHVFSKPHGVSERKPV